MTKLGIKSNILATLMCVVGMVGGYTGILLLAGYILLREEDKSLRKMTVKVVTIMCVASLAVCTIQLIPDVISWISSLLSVFGGSLRIGFLNTVTDMLIGLIQLARTCIFVIMALNAYKGKEFSVSKLDSIVESATDDGKGKSEGIDIFE